jgi:hypothetical protein
MIRLNFTRVIRMVLYILKRFLYVHQPQTSLYNALYRSTLLSFKVTYLDQKIFRIRCIENISWIVIIFFIFNNDSHGFSAFFPHRVVVYDLIE